MAYKVYAGRIDVWWAAGTESWLKDPLTGNVATGFATWVDKQLIYPNDEYAILDMQLDEDQNEIGTFTFTVPKMLQDPGVPSGERKNPIYDSLKISGTKIAIEEDGTIIWMGSVTEITLNFDLSQNIVCRDPLYALTALSTSLRMDVSLTVKDIFDTLVNRLFLGDDDGVFIPLTTGLVNVHSNETVDTTQKGTQISDEWSLLNTYLLNEYGGYVRLRYITTSDHNQFVAVADYLSTITDKTSQTVEYGQNLVDVETSSAIDDDLVNWVVASGYKTVKSGWWIWEKTSTEQISAQVSDDASFAKYGPRLKIIVSDKETTESALQELAQKELATYKQDIEPTVTVKAFDLCDAGVDTDHLGFLKKTHIISAPHGIDEWMVCTKASIPLDQPDQKEFTFGRPPEKLTAQNSLLGALTEQMQLSVRGLVSYAQGKG